MESSNWKSTYKVKNISWDKNQPKKGNKIKSGLRLKWKNPWRIKKIIFKKIMQTRIKRISETRTKTLKMLFDIVFIFIVKVIKYYLPTQKQTD
jgi:hypothetical protein